MGFKHLGWLSSVQFQTRELGALIMWKLWVCIIHSQKHSTHSEEHRVYLSRLKVSLLIQSSLPWIYGSKSSQVEWLGFRVGDFYPRHVLALKNASGVCFGQQIPGFASKSSLSPGIRGKYDGINGVRPSPWCLLHLHPPKIQSTYQALFQLSIYIREFLLSVDLPET